MLPSRRTYARAALLASLALVASACAKDAGPPGVASVTVVASSANLLVGPGGGQTTQLTATVLDTRGDPVEDAEIAWSTTTPLIIAVSPTGVVTAVRAGAGVARATVGSKVGDLTITVANVPVKTITLTPGPLAFALTPLGSTPQLLTATVRDSTSAPLTGRTVTWASTDAAIVSVSASGLVSAVGGGSAYVRASSEGIADSVVVDVDETDELPAGFDIGITDVQWTQGSQNASGTIPIIQGGRAAVVNVARTASHEVPLAVPFILELLTAADVVYYADTTGFTLSQGAASVVTTNVQFLVGAEHLDAGMRWRVRRDVSALADGTPANDVFPAGGASVALDLVSVPVLKLRFVPIVLTAHGNATGNVTPSSVEAYLSVVRALVPHGAIESSVGPPFNSSLSFGAPPTGGGPTFWTSLLPQLDAARVAHPTHSDAHWVGIVAVPSGYNFVTNGGWGYIPANGASTAPGTRTSLVVSYPWFGYEPQSRNLVAHELGHNLGRFHAPCGGAGNPDATYPVAGGRVGVGGHDTYSWQTGVQNRALPVDEDAGDLMGYCVPIWTSTYTYHGMLTFRGTSAPAARIATHRPHDRVPGLLVQGHLRDGSLTVEHARTLTAVPSDEANGEWTAIARDAAGTVLGSRRFTLGRYDHSETIRPFAVTIPMGAELASRVTTIDVVGPGHDRRFAVTPQ
jgi:hypothetical protein